MRVLSIAKKLGYTKIERFYEEAAEDGFGYAWVSDLRTYMAKSYSESDDEVAAVRLPRPRPHHPPYSGGSEEIRVIIETKEFFKNVVRATAFVIPKQHSLEDEVWSFVNKDTTADISDRFIFIHNNHRIIVIIKRK